MGSRALARVPEADMSLGVKPEAQGHPLLIPLVGGGRRDMLASVTSILVTQASPYRAIQEHY